MSKLDLGALRKFYFDVFVAFYLFTLFVFLCLAHLPRTCHGVVGGCAGVDREVSVSGRSLHLVDLELHGRALRLAAHPAVHRQR